MRIYYHTEIKNHSTIAQLLTESYYKFINKGRVITKKKRTDSEEVVILRDENGGITHE